MRRCWRADNYDSGGRTLVVVIFGSCLGLELIRAFSIFLFKLGWTDVH